MNRLAFRLPLVLVLRIRKAAPAGWVFDTAPGAPVGSAEWTTLLVTPPDHLQGRSMRRVFATLKANVLKVEGARATCYACDEPCGSEWIAR